jgi:hypothetical protein
MSSAGEGCEIREAVQRVASQGQQRLDRMLAVRERLEAALAKLRKTRAAIGAKAEQEETPPARQAAAPPPTYRAFFPALDALADELERLAADYEREIAEHAALF